MKKVWIGYLLTLMVLVAPVSAEFYRYKDPHGNVIYTDDLSKVPEAQRSQAKMYDESVSKTTSSDDADAQAAETSSRQAADELEALKIEGQRLLDLKAQLDQEYNALATENANLKTEQKEAVTPDQIKEVNKKVIGFNTRFQAYQEKSAVYQTGVDAYNKRLQAAESSTDPGDGGQSQ